MDRKQSYAADFGPFEGRLWLNTAHQGPLPRVAVEAAKNALEQKRCPHLLRDEEFFDVPRRLREALGRLTGASADDIILGNSTTYGLDLLANGMRWRAGDEVLLVKGDFPADVFPWLTLGEQGVTVRFVGSGAGAITAEEVSAEIGPHTRLFCTSWVNSFTGHVIDVDAIGRECRAKGVMFVLNASQGLGARVLDVEKTPVDAVTCCGFKWLCGPYATGFCWIEPKVRETLAVRHAYWLAMQAGRPLHDMREYTVRTDLGARAWDVFCTANFLNFVPWTASVEYLLEAGLENVSRYDQALVGRLLESLDDDRFELISPREEERRSTLVVVRPRKGEAQKWRARLSEGGFDVAVREGNLRISAHVHNSVEDIERVAEAMGG